MKGDESNHLLHKPWPSTPSESVRSKIEVRQGFSVASIVCWLLVLISVSCQMKYAIRIPFRHTVAIYHLLLATLLGEVPPAGGE